MVLIPVSTGSTQSMGQMLGQLGQGMGQGQRTDSTMTTMTTVVHPIVSLGDRLTVTAGSDGTTTISHASPSATGSDVDGKGCKEQS